MRVRSVPAEARMEVSVRLKRTVLMVSWPQERVAVGWVRASSQIWIVEEQVANTASV